MNRLSFKSASAVIALISILLLCFQTGRAQNYKSHTSGKYPFKAGDGIRINVFPDTTSFLNNIFPIDGRGNATFPIIGKINVLRMTTDDLAKLLKSTFSAYLRSTNMYISPMVRVSLLGGFHRPGLYYVDYDASLWEVVRRAGGPVLEDGVDEMVWERNGDEKSDDLAPLLDKGVSLRAMGFHSGDQIWTPVPGARTFWDAVRDVMPILTFATTTIITYYTIRQQQLLLQYGRRY